MASISSFDSQKPNLKIEGELQPTSGPSPPVPTIIEEQNSGILFQAKQIGEEILKFLKDEQWMQCVTELLAVSSHTCSLMEQTRATEMVPYIGIVSGPLYLYHAAQSAYQRFKFMVSACKTSRVADAFFWGIGGLGSFGIALSSIVKPIAGGVILFGLKGATINLVFSFVIPIILISFSILGGINQGWSLGKTEMAKLKLKQKTSKLRSLKDMETLLLSLQRPSKHNKEDVHNYTLDKVDFQNSHFSSDSRRKAIKNKIKELLSKDDSDEKLKRARESLGQVLNLMGRTKDLATSGEGSFFEQIDATITLTDETIQLAEKQGLAIENLKAGREELWLLKRQLCQEGENVIDSVTCEIHRKISMQNVGILNTLITLGAGILFLIGPKDQYYLGYILSLSSSAMGAINIVTDKAVSHEQFLKMERYLDLVGEKLPLLNPNAPTRHRGIRASRGHKHLA